VTRIRVREGGPTPESLTGAVASAQLARVRALARLLDTAVGIPGTRMRVGLDAVLGLVPGVGDVAGTVAAGYIVLTAVRLGAPRAVLARMLVNVGIDTAVGVVPVVGDLFDAGYRANARNVALLEAHLAAPAATQRASRRTVLLVVLGLALLAAAGVTLAVFAVRGLLALLG
jgi:hypothetical protein